MAILPFSTPIDCLGCRTKEDIPRAAERTAVEIAGRPNALLGEAAYLRSPRRHFEFTVSLA